MTNEPVTFTNPDLTSTHQRTVKDIQNDLKKSFVEWSRSYKEGDNPELDMIISKMSQGRKRRKK